jgi:hypothetical protein
MLRRIIELRLESDHLTAAIVTQPAQDPADLPLRLDHSYKRGLTCKRSDDQDPPPPHATTPKDGL